MRRVVVLVLSLVALGPTVAQASAWYRCAHDGELRAACCCPPAADARSRHHAAPRPDAAVHAACCCTVTQVAARAASVRGAPPAASAIVPVVAVVATPVPPPLEAPLRAAVIEQPRAPRGPPDPLFARHCSLLL